MDGRSWTQSGSGQGHTVCCCGHGNEPLCAIKCEVLVDQLWNYQLFKKDCASWNYSLISIVHYLVYWLHP